MLLEADDAAEVEPVLGRGQRQECDHGTVADEAIETHRKAGSGDHSRSDQKADHSNREGDAFRIHVIFFLRLSTWLNQVVKG